VPSIFFGSSNANIARILYQKLHVLALREIVADFGADRGILVSESGFQAGAVEAASFTSAQLISLVNLKSRASQASLFGLAVKPGAEAVYFVDDDDANTLNLLS
jgi:hypothetical protein